MKIIKYLWVLAILFSNVSSGANVRWKHPTPSSTLVNAALKEAQVIRSAKGKEINLENVSSLTALAADDQQDDFFLTTVDPDLTLYTKGFSRNPGLIGLIFEESFQRAGIPDKPVKGFVYHYKGKIIGATFSLPHMTHSENERSSMILHTQPLSPFTITVLYQDGTTASYDVKSVETRARFGGGFKSRQLDSFDGKLWLDFDEKYHYFVGMPYNR